MVKSFFKRYRKPRLHSPTKGFTLLELLVAMIVGSMISAGLLFIVVQLVQSNLRESARSDTQRDLQAAIDYIARDLREAVFVYDATCLLDRPAVPTPTTTTPSRCPGLRSYLPADIMGTSGFGATTGTNLTNVPVLAFWRVDELPNAVRTVCENNSRLYSTTGGQVQGVPCLSRRMYTLVVYSLNRAGGAVSRGRARIMRYTLPQFTTASVQTSGGNTTVRATTGWVDPRERRTLTDGTIRETSFLAWPVDQASLGGTTLSLQAVADRPTTSATNHVPLTDFVDWNGLYERSGGTISRGRAPNRTAEGLILTPADGAAATSDPPRGFYVYVRGGDRGGDLNQEVVIRIQGDADGRPGAPRLGTFDRPNIPIALETRVLTRGVTNKTL